MRERLDTWFAMYKCSASHGSSLEALGHRDPYSKETLFTRETKEALLQCKEKVQYLQDPLPLEQMYHVIKASPNSSHGLNEYLSRRGESTLEAFHLSLAHFGNTGMRDSLADNLNLTGTARHNLTIRYKLRLAAKTRDKRVRIPAAREAALPFFNHAELEFLNRLAQDAGLESQQFPFKDIEKLGSGSSQNT